MRRDTAVRLLCAAALASGLALSGCATDRAQGVGGAGEAGGLEPVESPSDRIDTPTVPEGDQQMLDAPPTLTTQPPPASPGTGGAGDALPPDASRIDDEALKG